MVQRCVHAMPPDAASPPGARRAAVVANPTKHDDVAKLKTGERIGIRLCGSVAQVARRAGQAAAWSSSVARNPAMASAIPGAARRGR